MTLNRLLTRLVWACLLPVALLAAYLAWDRVALLREANHRTAERNARDAALIIDLLLRGGAQALQTISDGRAIDSQESVRELYERAQAFRERFGSHVILVDRRLNMVFNTRESLGSPMPALPRPQGRAAVPMAMATGQPAVGDVFMGPVAGVPLVAMAVPVVRDGRVAYLLLATYEGGFLQQRLARVALPPGWAVLLRDGTGAIIASVSPPGFDPAATHPDERITAPLERAPWSVSVEIPSAIYHGAQVEAGSYLLVAVLLAVMIGVFGGTMTGRRLHRAVVGLLSGDPERAAFDIVEVGEVHRRLHDSVEGRKAAEAARHESEERFRALLEQSIAGVFMVQDDRMAYANPRMREIFGYPPGEDLDADPLACVAAEDRERVANRLRECLGSDVPVEYRFTGVRRDGRLIVVDVSARRAEVASRWAVIAVAQDVTERVRAEDETQRHLEQMQQAMQGTISVVSAIGEMRDPYTHGHEKRVAEIAVAIGREMNLPREQVEGLNVIGSLHDVGKIGIPSEILSKPARLSTIEMTMMRGHATASYEILRGVEFPWPVAEAAYQHHERIDGSGYPRGLKGDEIILEARVIAVADTVEAMASHRPYRPAIGIDAALAEIESGRGTKYDAAVVDACLRLFREKGYRLPG